MTFDDVINFHGHACPGLAIGFRVARLAAEEVGARAEDEVGARAEDEELVAVVENNSCAVDAIQAMLGCTFGKGNLIFKDYGKQVYTFIKRPSGEALRISVKWEKPKETEHESAMWQRFSNGDRSDEVMAVVNTAKARKMKLILKADDSELFAVKRFNAELPTGAVVYPSVTCEICGEKVMEPRTRRQDDMTVCIPCADIQGG